MVIVDVLLVVSLNMVLGGVVGVLLLFGVVNVMLLFMIVVIDWVVSFRLFVLSERFMLFVF